MQIDIPPEVIDDLRIVLDALEEAAHQHKDLHESEELVEPWKPSGAENMISCPRLTVGVVKKSLRIRKLLRL